MDAEQAYLFRHALLRSAAYELQPPGDRAGLHLHALTILQADVEAPAHDFPIGDDQPPQPHPHDAIAHDLAWHAAEANLAGAGELRNLQVAYLYRAAQAAETSYRNAEATRFWLQLCEITSGMQLAESQRRAGVCLHQGVDSARALRYLRQAADGFEARTNPRMCAVTLGAIALVYRETGRAELAERAYAESLELQRRHGARRDIGNAVANMATIMLNTGRFAQAEQLLREALAIHREVGNRASECMALSNLSAVHLEMRDYAQAEVTALEAIEIHREIGDLRGQGSALGNLSNVYALTERSALAQQIGLRALEIHHRVGNRRAEAAVLGNLAMLYDEDGRAALAEKTYLDAIEMERSAGNLRGEGLKLGNLGSFYVARKDFERAEECYLAAIKARHSSGDQRGAARTQLSLAMAYQNWGRTAQCDRFSGEAIGTALRLGDEKLAGDFACQYALLLLLRPDVAAARKLWAKGVAQLRGADDAALRRHTEEMLEVCRAANIEPMDAV